MKLADYINQFPRNKRATVRKRIAEHCDVSESCVRHWANGTRSIPMKQALHLQKLDGFDVSVDEMTPIPAGLVVAS